MPRIKSPINPQEVLYNKRYERETQRAWISKIRANNLDEYTKNFLQRATIILHSLTQDGNNCLSLTEKQADFLAELYNKYSS